MRYYKVPNLGSQQHDQYWGIIFDVTVFDVIFDVTVVFSRCSRFDVPVVFFDVPVVFFDVPVFDVTVFPQLFQAGANIMERFLSGTQIFRDVQVYVLVDGGCYNGD